MTWFQVHWVTWYPHDRQVPGALDDLVPVPLASQLCLATSSCDRQVPGALGDLAPQASQLCLATSRQQSTQTNAERRVRSNDHDERSHESNAKLHLQLSK